MSGAAVAAPRIRHAMRGRLRVYLPGLTDSQRQPIEIRLGRLAGVRHVRANPLTGSVLVQFDPATTDETAVLAELRPLPAAEPPARGASPLPLVLRLAGVVVGGALLLARRFGQWTEALPGGRAPATVVSVLGFLVSTPPARAALEHCLGPGAAELLRSLTDLLANILGGDWLGLALQALAAISA
jgi:hypothetical protein